VKWSILTCSEPSCQLLPICTSGPRLCSEGSSRCFLGVDGNTMIQVDLSVSGGKHKCYFSVCMLLIVSSIPVPEVLLTFREYSGLWRCVVIHVNDRFLT